MYITNYYISCCCRISCPKSHGAQTALISNPSTVGWYLDDDTCSGAVALDIQCLGTCVFMSSYYTIIRDALTAVLFFSFLHSAETHCSQPPIPQNDSNLVLTDWDGDPVPIGEVYINYSRSTVSSQ